MSQPNHRCILSRRDFLFASALTVTTVTLPLGCAPHAPRVQARIGHYPRQRIGSLKDLTTSQPQTFRYPDNEAHSNNILVKLGTRAGGGVGAEEDIVAFNLTCSHQGGRLKNTFKADNFSLGPCPFHLTSFDLTRHGMLITGQATQSLPQIVLELEGDEIMATGVLGLIYGRHQNRLEG
ncbi:arsenate reductase (azurin) small subunit [Magnetococcus sp. PR-3]|uniref:arsenate reductase (azurin) small subunit n=1 Tax=Magnetococcus sp. PR-3 TaxID=3120355 RepID=UPI002FCE4497